MARFLVCAGEDSPGPWTLLASVLSVVSSGAQRLITREEHVCSAVWQHLCGTLASLLWSRYALQGNTADALFLSM